MTVSMRGMAAALAVALGLAVVTGHIPGLVDAEGRTFGIYRLNAYNDWLHALSAIWAAPAAYLSRRASMMFLRIFGTLYFLDGVMGVAVGSGYLDLGILIKGVLDLPLGFKVLASLPHLILGGIGIVSGFFLAQPEEQHGGRAQ